MKIILESVNFIENDKEFENQYECIFKSETMNQ